MPGELVSITNSRGLELNGLLYRAPRASGIVVHIHGSLGNFYQNNFVHVMAEHYVRAGFHFLSSNTSAHDGVSEGYRNKSEFEYVGGSVVSFEECLYDIQGIIAYARQLSGRVVLQGHSLGCDRVLHFLITRKSAEDCVLLAPCDSYQLHRRWIAPETVEDQISRLKSETPTDPIFDWLSSREYGAREPKGWTYPIPITRSAFLSIAEGPPFRLMNIERPCSFKLEQRALIYIGGKDSLQVWSPDIMFEYLGARMGHVTKVHVADGDHMLAGCEAEVATQAVAWLSEGS